MAQKEVVVEAHTLQECKEKGAHILEVEIDKIQIEILEEGKTGFLGRGKPYRVKVFLPEKESSTLPPQEETEKLYQTLPPQSNVLGEIQGEFGIYTFQSDGLYVIVPPPAKGEREIEFVQILEETQNLNFINIDLDALGIAIEKVGSKIKIGGPQPKSLLLKKSIKVEEPKSSYVLFEFKEDGVYLKPIFKQGSDLSLDKIQEDIHFKKKLADVDLEAVKFAIEGSGEAVKIAPLQSNDIKKNGSVDLEIASDKMQAKIIVYPPFGGNPATELDVLKIFQKNNIKYIPEDTQIKELLESGNLFKCWLTIFGKKPTAGNDAEIQYLFEKEVEKKPTELEDGRVDYRDLGTVRNITKGEILAKKTPPTLGNPGETIDGDEIPALAGKDLPIPIGKGVELSEDGITAIASIDGCPAMVGGKVSVLPVYEVKNNVDMSVGNIDFVGNVIIRGDVTSGFTVKANGTVDIFGNVEDACVESTGKINIRGGVYGRGKGLVKTAEDIAVRFVERGNLKAQGSIKIGEAVMHSNITAGKKVTVGGKKALIVGGMVRAGETVEARTIGSHLATPTEIEVGVDPELKEELKKIEQKLNVDQENLNKTQHAINTLKELQKKMVLDENKKELLLKLTRTQFQLMAQLKQTLQRKSELDEAIKTTVTGKISASDRIYPGVKVSIKDAVMLITEDLKYVSLTEKDNKIKQGSFR